MAAVVRNRFYPLAAMILTLYDLAAKERGSDAQRKRFEELLLRFLAKW